MSTEDTPRDARIEALWLSWNIPYELKEFELAEIRTLDGAQVRDLGHIAPSEGVEEYATQMKAGAAFPPIVVMKPNILIDGNTRLAAAHHLKLETFPAYVIDVPTIDFAKAVAGALNQLNGRRLTSSEAHGVAMTMLRELKFTDEQVAANVGRSAQMVRTWRLQAETENRGKRLGLGEPLEQVSQNQRVRLASISHDAPFGELLKLVSEVKVPNAELNRVVKEVKKAPSDADALEVVAKARREWKQIGPEPRSAQVNKTARRARMVIPQLLNMNPVDVFDPERVEEDRAMWDKLRQLTEAVAKVFEARQTAQPAA
jgi:ParB-like chromosome segregation protein Spo0J